MTHKSSHAILDALMASPDITPEEMLTLQVLVTRDKFSWRERWLLAYMVYRLLG